MVIFDLDQTLIDSSIRENLCNVNGKLYLPLYMAQKAENIKYDTLTTLGQWLENEGHKQVTFALLTARQIEHYDIESLAKIMPNTIKQSAYFVSRNTIYQWGGVSSQQDSGLYKKPVIKGLASIYNKVLVVDDCPKVCTIARELGQKAIKAQVFWTMTPENAGQYLIESMV